ncbi:isochorismate synthase [Microbacterium album]|uniref:Isochorismate synthase n=1 Tax=Microbacterium album TaxID=2053191 RepID=A0A917MKJ0_9MICO|nr:chorismate-binding protein [Microbacterium album]GGH36392.1 isochorismate synthase [Microbacterium album]
MTESARPPRLTVETREVDPVEDLLPFTSADDPTAWLRRGDGMVGAGPAVLRLSVTGEDRIARLADAWREISAESRSDDEIAVPGTGLVAFGALAFDDSSALASTLTVPSTILGRRGGRAWITRIRREDEPFPAVPRPAGYGPHWSATLGPGRMDPAAHGDAVRAALGAIDAGEVAKVVVARDIAGTVPASADLRRLIRALMTGYPDTWAYAVDGIIGASPETLVTVRGGAVTARVLAGTRPRGADADEDTAITAELAASAKDLDEHGYAVRSVLEALRPHTSALAAAEQPFTLKLPNLWHLATDVEGTLSNGSSALDMARALHPTAAVAGTPRDAATALIRRIEPFDRGRYAGPVGWIDARGDGEWAIALRCAQFEPAAEATPDAAGAVRGVTAHAGGGIVAGSAPEAELLETRVKFRPIVDALA